MQSAGHDFNPSPIMWLSLKTDHGGLRNGNVSRIWFPEVYVLAQPYFFSWRSKAISLLQKFSFVAYMATSMIGAQFPKLAYSTEDPIVISCGLQREALPLVPSVRCILGPVPRLPISDRFCYLYLKCNPTRRIPCARLHAKLNCPAATSANDTVSPPLFVCIRREVRCFWYLRHICSKKFGLAITGCALYWAAAAGFIPVSSTNCMVCKIPNLRRRTGGWHEGGNNARQQHPNYKRACWYAWLGEWRTMIGGGLRGSIFLGNKGSWTEDAHPTRSETDR